MWLGKLFALWGNEKEGYTLRMIPYYVDFQKGNEGNDPLNLLEREPIFYRAKKVSKTDLDKSFKPYDFSVEKTVRNSHPRSSIA
jgi:hypothetical protein